MGCDIHPLAQKRGADGKWQAVMDSRFAEGYHPFNWRSYGLYGWLAGVRNYSDVPPISEPRGYPADFDPEHWDSWSTAKSGTEPEWGGPDYISMGDHSASWLSVEELLAYDYDQTIEDLRISKQIAPNIFSGGVTGVPGEGKLQSLRDFLGESFFKDLALLQELGATRVVFSFDS
jgi:hypothetical protein